VSPALPIISGADAVRAFGKAGFERVSQRGSHVKLRHRDGRVVIVPMHDELARGTLRSMLRQADLSPDDFLQLL
jgi:predicted RNA binding protein YcfA (HicA-like mRNA interferase family)